MPLIIIEVAEQSIDAVRGHLESLVRDDGRQKRQLNGLTNVLSTEDDSMRIMGVMDPDRVRDILARLAPGAVNP